MNTLIERIRQNQQKKALTASIDSSEEFIAMENEWKPQSIDAILTRTLFTSIDKKIVEAATALTNNGWRFYAVSQSRGRCYYLHKVITIPVWAIRSPRIGKKAQYIAHEIAHAIAGPTAKHGIDFMKAMQSICPPEYWHYELEYKPKSAMLCGIVGKDFFDWFIPS